MGYTEHMTLSLILSILSLLISIASVLFARKSADASEASADAAETTASLDEQRRHAELIPKFRFTWVTGRLAMRLLSPPELGQLSKVILKIRDDIPDRSSMPSVGHGPTAQEIKDHVWGPWMLQSGIDSCSDKTGRTSSERSLEVGEDLIFDFYPTRPGRWMITEGFANEVTEAWKRDRGTLLRFTVECWHDNWEQPWILKPEIDTDLRDKEKVVVEFP